MRQYSKPYRLQIFIGSFAKFIEAIIELYIPFLMADILDFGIKNGDKSVIISKGVNIGALVLIGFICSTICQYTASFVSQKMATTARYELMEHISKFSYYDLDKFGTSTLVNRLTVDFNNYQYMLVMAMRMAVRSPAIGIGAIAMSLLIDVKLAMIFVILVPILAVIVTLFMRHTAPLFKLAQQKLDDFALIIRENLSGIRVIRAFATVENETKKANKSAKEASDAYMKVESILAFMNPINSLLLNAAVIFILFMGAQKINTGSISQGNVLSLTIYASKVLYALIAVANLIVIITRGLSSQQRIGDIFDHTPSMAFPAKTIHRESKEDGYIIVKNLSFSYPSSGQVIKDISFSINKGEIIGIVGVTGSGKTTLINLLQRFYDGTSGYIQIAGADIKDYALSDLRKVIGTVPQEKVLFSGSIKDNLKMAKPNATNEELVAALKTAQCLEFVEALPNGINQQVNQGGKNFSGGQQQRLTIARSLVARPEILILDDCLSALDYKTDYNLRSALKSDLPNSTIFIISQRISSVIKADKILVLDNGKLLGFDNHDNLLKSCDLYKNIYLSQLSISEEATDE